MEHKLILWTPQTLDWCESDRWGEFDHFDVELRGTVELENDLPNALTDTWVVALCEKTSLIREVRR